MIHAIYLINEGGICIFEHHYVEKKMDSDLVTGFMNAVGSFAKEAFFSGLQKIDLEGGRRLVYGMSQDAKILAAVLTDAEDYPSLIVEILDKIISEFVKEYGTSFGGAIEPKKYQNFSQKVDEIVLRRIRKRGIPYLIIGSVLGAIVMGLLFMFVMDLIPDEGPNALYLLVPPPIIAGLIAGNRKHGVIAGILSISPFFIIMFISDPMGIFQQGILIIIDISMALTFGLIFGFIIERYYLYPLKPQDVEKIEELKGSDESKKMDLPTY